MTITQILILAIVQGLTELLPVSSSAHVILVERLMGLDPGSAQMSFLLVMLHTGTMFSVLIYFWRTWKSLFSYWKAILIATAFTGSVALMLKFVIEHFVLRPRGQDDIEALFRNLPLIACSLAAVGVLIIVAGFKEKQISSFHDIDYRRATIIGIIQAVCLPFRGFSRSGATISTGILLKIKKARAEEFSFALALILTPPVVAREGYRLVKHFPDVTHSMGMLLGIFWPGLLGMVFSFAAGLGALRWLSSWLELGYWKYFGYHCLCAAAAALFVNWLAPMAN